MYKIAWIIVLAFAWGCRQSPVPVEADKKPSVEEFALKPPRVPSDIRTEMNTRKEALKNKVKQYRDEDNVFKDASDAEYRQVADAETSASRPHIVLAKKVEILLKQLEEQQKSANWATSFNRPSSLSLAQRNALLKNITQSTQVRRSDWQKTEAEWEAKKQPSEATALQPIAPASLWNKRLVLSCADKLYKTVNEPPLSSEYLEKQDKKPEQIFEPEAFLKSLELSLAQKEEWKNAQKEKWAQWIKESSLSEQYDAFEEILKKIIEQSSLKEDLDVSWTDRMGENYFYAYSDSDKKGTPCVSTAFVKDVEELGFLESLLSLLPKPWRTTQNSILFCEEISGEECMSGGKKISWLKAEDDYSDRYEITSVSCKKGFLPSGDCRLDYNRVASGAGYYKKISCDVYFNGKCYGEFYSLGVASDARCLPQPSTEWRIKKSDFDGTWGYYQSVVGCDGQDYEVLCDRVDPKTLVCQEGTYRELADCELNSVRFSGTVPDGCVPLSDIRSCEIKDGVCINEAVIEGKPREGNLPTASEEDSGQREPKEKMAFRLKLPDEYIFE